MEVIFLEEWEFSRIRYLLTLDIEKKFYLIKQNKEDKKDTELLEDDFIELLKLGKKFDEKISLKGSNYKDILECKNGRY